MVVFSKNSYKKISVSKNRKKYWKKHCDVSEIEEHLEEKRKEEILGGPVSEKTDEQIFFQDKTEIPKTALKRKHLTDKPLRCFQALENTSKVEPLGNIRKHKTCNVVKKMQRLLVKKQQANERNILANDIRDSEKKLRSYNNEMLTGTYDIWDAEDAPFDEKVETEIEDEQINEYYKEFTKKKRFKLPKLRLPKEFLLSAVDVPHQGASYNPSYDDHEELLEMAICEEEQITREKAKMKKKGIRSVNASSLAESYVQEMSQGLVDADDIDDESDVDCSLPLSVNPPVRAEDRKTKRNRRRASEHKKRISAIRIKKIQAYRERQALKIPHLKSQIMAEEARQEERKLKRAKKQAIKALRPKRTSREKYKPPNIDVTLSKDLVGSLYQIKTKGNLAHERMKSFERRSIIETRSSGSNRRTKRIKRKMYVKRSYKDAEI